MIWYILRYFLKQLWTGLHYLQFSFLKGSFLVYRKMYWIFICWFCILLFCWKCLSYLRVFWWYLEDLLRQDPVCPPSLLGFFLYYFLSLVSVSCLITSAKVYSTVLNESGQSRHYCLVLDFRFTDFIFSIWGTVGNRFPIEISLCWSGFLLALLFSGLLLWQAVEVCARLFYIDWNDCAASIFNFIYLLNYIHWFAFVEPTLHPWTETNLIMVYNLLLFLTPAWKIFIENVRVCVHLRNLSPLYMLVVSFSDLISE